AYGSSEITHTDLGSQPYWTLDLGSVQNIETINIWNRTDCCSNRLTNFHVFVSDLPFTGTSVNDSQNQQGVLNLYTAGTAGTTTGLSLTRTGRYVRVQLSNTAVTGENVLSLAEVQVFGN
ncbi:MAG: discoidin domain-containing protein, partial [Colwellia sp.]|nr:discoidin domain-containing protein [Colwellia sp.]